METTEIPQIPYQEKKKESHPTSYERKGNLREDEITEFDRIQFLLRTFGVARKTIGPGPLDKDVQTMVAVNCIINGVNRTFEITHHAISAKSEIRLSINITEKTEGAEIPSTLDYKKEVDTTINNRTHLKVTDSKMTPYNESYNKKIYRDLLKSLTGASFDLQSTAALERAFLERSGGRKDYENQGRRVRIGPALELGEPSISASGHDIIEKDANTRKRKFWRK